MVGPRGSASADAQAPDHNGWSAGSSVTWWALIAATAVGIALRAIFVGDQSIGYEEVFTAAVVHHATLAGVWHAIKSTEITPPLYYLVTWLWVKLAASHAVVVLRGTSLAAGSVTVPVAYLATRRFVGGRVALAVAWLCAVSPVLVEYSIYARSYALFVLVGALSVWALGAVIEQPSSWRRWALWALAATACAWTHYFAGYLLVGEVVVLVVKLPAARRQLSLCMAAFVVATVPLWSVFLAQNGVSNRPFIAAQSLTGRLEGVVRQLAMGTNVPNKWLEGAGILLAVGAVLLAVAQTRRRPSTLVLGAVALAGAGLPIVAAVTGVDDHLLPRNVLGIWICVAPLGAYGLTRLRSIPLALYSVLCIVTIVLVQTNWRYQASTDWQGASARVEQRAAGEPVAVMPGTEQNVASYYLHRAPLAAPVRTSDLWVMVEPARGPHERALTPIANPPLAQLWGTGFRAVGEIDYRGFRLIHLHAATPTLVTPVPADNGPATAPLASVLSP